MAEGQYKILLVTSGTGSRLGGVTSYTNKSLVRVGEKPAISYIVESYPEYVEIVVTLGHFGDQVKDFLLMFYPKYKFKFVNVDKYEGKGSSLGYSLLQAKDELDCPFIFQACDTLPFDTFPAPCFNWCGGTARADGSHYRTLNVSAGEVNRINEKDETDYDYDYIGLAGINDHKLFWEVLQEEYEIDEDNGQLSDCHAINRMIQMADVKFNFLEFPKWQDIGNVKSLERARKSVNDTMHVLDKDDESIYIINNKVVKFFNNVEVCRNRIRRAELLQPLVPKVIDKSDNFYSYGYANGKLFSKSVNMESFKTFLTWASSKLWKKSGDSSKEFYGACRKFYFDKTYSRIDSFMAQNNIADEPTSINGIEVPTVKEMVSSLDESWLCDVPPYQFHGDFILDNVIETDKGFKLIDWRQDFGGVLEGGDIYYDLAKLNHNLVVSHDIARRTLYSIDITPKGVECDILRKNMLMDCQGIFNEFCLSKGYDLKKVRVLSSLIWLNMSALHHYPFNIFLFYFGKYNLHKELDE
jgi:choline kinase